jgi:hypothetical protein
MKKNSFFNLNLPDKIFGIDSSLLVFFLPPVVLFVVFLVSLNLILIPKINEIGLVSKKIDSVKLSTSKINEQNNYLISIDQKELQQNAEYLDNAVLKDKRSYLLVGIIRQVADKYGYQMSSFSLTPGELKNTTGGKELENMVKMPVSLILYGPENKSLDFVLALEKTLPILFIDKFDVSTTNGTSKLDLVIYSYYANDNVNVDVNNISLNDLILSSDELTLIKEISSFNKINENEAGVGTTQFQQYQRENPFSL